MQRGVCFFIPSINKNQLFKKKTDIYHLSRPYGLLSITETKLELKTSSLGDIGMTEMTHNGATIAWDISVIDKTSFSGKFDIFEELNRYWGKQSATKQDKIFDVYRRIKEAFGSVWSYDELIMTLYKLVAELMELHSLADVEHYVSFYSNIRIPADLGETFKESYETSRTRERTYLKSDYQKLVVMTLALRCMIPVWGEFISRTEDELGTTYKEYYATRLLMMSSIVHSEPWEKLRVFVEQSLPNDKSLISAIMGGISREDFPFWVMSLVVVRRLSVGDLRGINLESSSEAPLVSFIHSYIINRVKGHDANFIGGVKERMIEGQGQDSENNLSKLEGYKIKQEIPAGDISIIRHQFLNPYDLAKKISPEINLALVDVSLQSVKALEHEQVWKPQVVLAQWVLRKAIPPRGMMQMKKNIILEALAITQAVLWHHNHKELAGLATAIVQPSRNVMSLIGTGQRHRIPKELVEELNALYPFSRRSGKQLRTGKPQNSTAVTSVEMLEKMFSEHEWRLTLPAQWIPELTGNNDQRYPIPADIKIKLAQLALAVAKRVF